jgi:transcriptional regulator with XRE-family HTH domain
VPQNRLRELRLEEGYTQEQLAKRLARKGIRVNASTISRWEHSQVTIPDPHKPRLAEFFGVSVAYLLGFEDDR